MENPGEFDQQCAAMRDKAPALWMALYKGCLEQGFTEEQSLRLVIAYIDTLRNPH